MQESDILIHIGYHKTGTTLLQRRVFSAETSGFSLAGGAAELEGSLVRAGNFSFNQEPVRGLVSTDARRAMENGKVPVISYERLSGMPHRGGYDSKLMADRLKETFPDAKIFVVIREQVGMIASLYKTYIRMGGVATLEEYLPGGGDAGSLLFRFDYLEYDGLIDYYRTLFGADHVKVLPYELLESRPRQFLKQLQEFAGLPYTEDVRMPKVNVSPSRLTLVTMRQINRWAVRTAHNPSPVLPVHLKNLSVRQTLGKLDVRLPRFLRDAGREGWESYVATRTQNLYRKSNSRTSELTGLDLSSYDYECD